MPIDEQIQSGQNAVIKYFKAVYRLGILYINLMQKRVIDYYLSLGFCGKINAFLSCQAINMAFYFLICHLARQYYINHYYPPTLFTSEPQTLVECFSECLNPSIEQFSEIYQTCRDNTEIMIENLQETMQEKFAELPDHQALYLAWQGEQ